MDMKVWFLMGIGTCFENLHGWLGVHVYNISYLFNLLYCFVQVRGALETLLGALTPIRPCKVYED